MKDRKTGVTMDSADALQCPSCRKHPPIRVNSSLIEVLTALAKREPDAAIFSIICKARLRGKQKTAHGRPVCGRRYTVRLAAFVGQDYSPTFEELLAHETQLEKSLADVRGKIDERNPAHLNRKLIVLPGATT